MPSPIGHALGGLAAGWLVAGRPRDLDGPLHGRASRWRREALWFAALGLAADIDLLFGWHSGPTHSVGAAILAGLVLLAAQRAGGLAIHRPFLAGAAAYGSHPLLDWLGADNSPPLGVMAFWPLSTDYYIAPAPLLMAISRRYWLPGFLTHNLRAIALELALLGPTVALVWLMRRAGRRRRLGEPRGCPGISGRERV
ncbi:MAG TPA: metal-dependent hydrolase [Vicinamibacterales bacterium]|nr:metal-dependent hydrolase [Vicinamibacterales bacterium]